MWSDEERKKGEDSHLWEVNISFFFLHCFSVSGLCSETGCVVCPVACCPVHVTQGGRPGFWHKGSKHHSGRQRYYCLNTGRWDNSLIFHLIALFFSVVLWSINLFPVLWQGDNNTNLLVGLWSKLNLSCLVLIFPECMGSALSVVVPRQRLIKGHL